jgi:hypothetical protein
MQTMDFQQLKALVESKNQTHLNRNPLLNKIMHLEQDLIDADIPAGLNLAFNDISESMLIGTHGYKSDDYALLWDKFEKSLRLIVINLKINKKLLLKNCPTPLQEFILDRTHLLNEKLIQVLAEQNKKQTNKLMDDAALEN